MHLASATSLRDILATLKAERPDAVIIDSIQTLGRHAVGGPRHGDAGSRRRAGTGPPRQTAGSTLLLVGHVTKDGQIAGPAVSSTWSTR